MKTLTVKENSQGRTATVNARTTYQTKSGEWIAEVDEKEFSEACFDVCQDIKGCRCENLHVEADQDDDGKKYSISTG
jgi:hypothetical protein